jgi:hypothetical protein
LQAAAARAPETDRDAGSVAAEVAASQAERASVMYRAAVRSDTYEPYLDGYGYYRAAEAILVRDTATIRAANPEAFEKLKGAVAALASAYPSAGRQPALTVDAAALFETVSDAASAAE